MGNIYNKNEKSKCVIYLDANNFNGYAISQPLPVGNLKF